MDEKAKKSKINIRTVLRIAVVAVIVAVLYFGARDPAITVDGGNIKIGGMFGTTIPVSDVKSVALLDESMSELGTGRRTSGYGGFDDTLRGQFDFNGDKRLLYVRGNSAPTIYIDRYGDRDVYISFRDEAETVHLYDKLVEVCEQPAA